VADARWYLPGERAMSLAVAVASVAVNVALGLLLLAHRRVRTAAEALVAEKDDALTRSEGAFLAVTESARVAIVLTDAQGRFTYANAAAEEMFGEPRARLVGASSMQYVAAADRARFKEGLDKFIAGEGRISSGAPTPIRGVRASGEEFPAEIALSWFDGADGRYITGVIVDLSERVRAEAAAMEAETRWKVAIDSTDDGVWDWDIEAGVIRGSRRLFEMLGHESPDGTMSDAVWNSLIHPDDLATAHEDLYGHLGGHRPQYVSEYRTCMPDGSYRWVLGRGRVMSHTAEGAPLRMVGTCTDITERRGSEETLRFAREQAEQAARSKSDFLAMMSHELRTPMNGVLGMTNLLSTTELNGEQREYLDMIGRSGNALLRLIDDILDFSKIEAGRVVLEQVSSDVGAIAREVVTLLGVQAHSRGLQLEATIAPGTPTIVVTDPGRLRQVLFNLVGNAIKFTEAGSVAVAVSADHVADGRATLRVAVTDTGIGIPDDKQRLLFEKFTQADASTTRRFGGTGLGLAISKGLVESLGGRIGVTSAVGRGSQFWFTFQAVMAAGAAPEPDPFPTDLREAEPYAQASPAHRILVAEDNPVNQRVALRMLEKLGYAVDVAVNGREAVQMVQGTSYAALFMDCHMPEMDGFEATRQIRQLALPGPRLPILAMTAAAAEGDRERCLACGMDDYLRKPVQVPELRAMLERWVRAAPVG
jgi:PAS domain S-box-containing protein